MAMGRVARGGPRAGAFGGTVPGTGWSWPVLAGLVVSTLPRSVLAELGVVRPEGSALYYVLALAPFAFWLGLAVVRRTPTPLRDHLLAGAVYGVSLVVVHETLGPPLRGLARHGSTVGIAMTIGLGAGLVAGLVAAAATWVRAIRARPGGPRVPSSRSAGRD